MRTVIIGFSKSKKKFPIFSWLIRLIDDKRFSHVYIKWFMKSGTPIIYQASGHAVNFVGNKRFESKNQVYREFSFEISDEKFQEFIEWAVYNSDAPYSLALGFGMWWAKVFGLKRNPFAKNETFVCSKLAGYVLDKYIKDVIANEKDAEILMPSDIYDFCLGAQNG